MDAVDKIGVIKMDVLAQGGLSQLKHDAGENTQALKWFQSVESACQKSASFHLPRAKCHAFLGDLEACALPLREAHRIDPDLRMLSVEDPAFEAIYGP